MTVRVTSPDEAKASYHLDLTTTSLSSLGSLAEDASRVYGAVAISSTSKTSHEFPGIGPWPDAP
jgi:hypothetical protein